MDDEDRAAIERGVKQGAEEVIAALGGGEPRVPAVRSKIARNAPCPCGSGKKYKKCCLKDKPKERDVYPLWGPPPMNWNL